MRKLTVIPNRSSCQFAAVLEVKRGGLRIVGVGGND